MYCHAGACPPCQQVVKRRCYCGKTSKNGKCGDGEGLFSCGKVCGKPLQNCRHGCGRVCHEGPCEEKCEEEVVVKCKCGKRVGKEVCWRAQQMKGYSAKMPVQVVLECSEERCGKVQPITQPTTQSTTPAKKTLLLLSVLVVVLAMVVALWLRYAHSCVCDKQPKVQTIIYEKWRHRKWRCAYHCSSRRHRMSRDTTRTCTWEWGGNSCVPHGHAPCPAHTTASHCQRCSTREASTKTQTS